MKEWIIAHTGEGPDDWTIAGSEEDLSELLKLARLGFEYYKSYKQNGSLRYATNDVSDFMAGIRRREEGDAEAKS